jgi:hypothetical protein
MRKKLEDEKSAKNWRTHEDQGCQIFLDTIFQN